MGEYNGTCGISHLPIEAGDPVAAVLIRPFGHPDLDMARGFDGFTGTGKAWQAASLPFTGAYDGRGAFVPDAGTDDRLARDLFGRSLRDMLESHAEGEAVTVGRNHEIVRLMLIHRDLYDRLSSATARGEHAAEARRIPELLDAVRTLHAAGGRGGPATFERLREIETWSEATGRPWQETPYAARILATGDGDGIAPALGRAIVAWLGYMETTDERDEQAELMSRALALKILDENMAHLRRSWAPQGGMGQAEEDYALHREVAAWAAGRCLEADPDLDGAPRP